MPKHSVLKRPLKRLSRPRCSHRRRAIRDQLAPSMHGWRTIKPGARVEKRRLPQAGKRRKGDSQCDLHVSTSSLVRRIVRVAPPERGMANAKKCVKKIVLTPYRVDGKT